MIVKRYLFFSNNINFITVIGITVNFQDRTTRLHPT